MYSVLAALSPSYKLCYSHWVGGFWGLTSRAELYLREEQPVKRPAGPQAKNMRPQLRAYLS